jgi:hypothetical protein
MEHPRMANDKNDKPVYETPKVIPLGDLIKSTGGLTSCSSGTNAKNICTRGGAPRPQQPPQ